MKWFFVALLAGVLASSPFLTTRALGTREAYNYSLSVADAVTQARQGEVPMLVGQTEFAFNGRIHPLRTAPALPYLASALDLATFRQLSFWTLQNLVLGGAIIAAAASAYLSLRWATGCAEPEGAALAALYVVSPAVLASAFGMDLYMTVLTTPLVPVVLAANLVALQGRRWPATWILVAALAACWLAHPPVALWMSAVTGLLQLVALVRRPPGRGDALRLPLAAALFLVLAGYGFLAALTIAPLDDVNKHYEIAPLFVEVERTFGATFRPVSPAANQLGDFQLGYAYWALAAAAAGCALLRRSFPALVLLGTAAFVYLFVAPVPGVHRWLWTHAPSAVFNLTNQWPMQRLYLPITALLLFAFALSWRRPANRNRFVHDALRLALAAGMGWSFWQGGRFLSRGFSTRQTPEATAISHLPTNLDLTPISYALLGTPGDFANGPMDPAFAFRLLAPYDARPVASNWDAALPAAAAPRRLFAVPGDTDDILNLGSVVLEPGRRYRLTFEFLTPPVSAIFQLRGPTVHREYPLPASGGPRAFGMNAGHRRSLTLWTDQASPETVALRLVGPGLARSELRGRAFANLATDRVVPEQLPVALESLLPLRARCAAPSAGYLETPRSFLPGYAAAVDGQPVRVQRSPDGLVMLPVPAGTSRIELRYAGPPRLRLAFWLGGMGWAGLALVAGSCFAPRAWRETPARLIRHGREMAVAAGRRVPRRVWLVALAGIVALAAGGAGWQRWREYRAGVGPIRVRFVLPQGGTNRQQPLVVTGRPHAGMFVYALFLDSDHVKIGVDIWGLLGVQSEPIRADYLGEHEIVVDAGALYPPDHPALGALDPATARRLRNRLRVVFDGQVVFDRETTTHESTAAEVTVGENRIGGSSCEPHFAGEILSVERLPLPAR